MEQTVNQAIMECKAGKKPRRESKLDNSEISTSYM